MVLKHGDMKIEVKKENIVDLQFHFYSIDEKNLLFLQEIGINTNRDDIKYLYFCKGNENGIIVYEDDEDILDNIIFDKIFDMLIMFHEDSNADINNLKYSERLFSKDKSILVESTIFDKKYGVFDISFRIYSI